MKWEERSKMGRQQGGRGMVEEREAKGKSERGKTEKRLGKERRVGRKN